jgi:hypothetical protein
MKALICLTLAVSALASPALSFAQTNSGPLTRAQVRADLIRFEQAGYTPSGGEDPHYPAAIQAAEAKIGEQDGARLAADAAGGAAAGAAQAGSSLTRKQVYDQLVQAEQDGSLARLDATLYQGG